MQVRAAVLHRQGVSRPYAASRPLDVTTVDLASPHAGEVLVGVKAAGLCHSDLTSIEGPKDRPLPAVLGHEGAGVVVEMGDGITDLAPGDHVVFVFTPSCGACRLCRAGRPALCPQYAAAKRSGELATGGRRLTVRGQSLAHYVGISCFADHAVVPRVALQRIDDDIPFDVAALFGCAVLTGVGAAVNTARVRPGDSVAILGLGGIGLSCLLGCVVSGAGRIVAVDLVEEKLELARELGATHTVNAGDPEAVARIRADEGVDVAFEMSGSLAAFQMAYESTARGGLTVVAGLSPTGDLAVPATAFVSEGRRISGSYLGDCVIARDLPRYLDLYRQGRLPVDRLLSSTVTLDGVNEAFDLQASGSGVRHVIGF